MPLEWIRPKASSLHVDKDVDHLNPDSGKRGDNHDEELLGNFL